MPTQAQVHVAARVHGFTYAIRNVVAEARKVEAAGTPVRYLNIGDPIPFGFKTPPHLIEAVDRAMRDGHNGYTASVGVLPAREAVAAEYEQRGMPVGPDPTPGYPLYTAVLAKLAAKAVHYRTDPDNNWQPDIEDITSKMSPRTRAIVIIDPNNPTGAVYPEATRRALIDLAERAGVPILADEVYGDLAFDGPSPLIGSLAPDAPILSFSSLSKAYVAPGWRAGWLAVGRSPRLDDVLAAIKKLADGRLCSTGPMQYAIHAALTGDRTHQQQFVKDLAVRADLTTRRFNAIPGMSCVAPQAAFYAMPKIDLPKGRTDEDFVLGLLRSTGILCVYGSGFGLPADQGFFRVVFLASPDELSAIYDDVAAFTERYLADAAR
jgi:alanine-synthesizing transaminase